MRGADWVAHMHDGRIMEMKSVQQCLRATLADHEPNEHGNSAANQESYRCGESQRGMQRMITPKAAQNSHHHESSTLRSNESAVHYHQPDLQCN